MADNLKILGQVTPLAVTLTTGYTVPGGHSTTVSSVVVCNRSATPTTFRLSAASGGAADDPKQYIYYDQVIEGNSTFVATIGISLATTDVLRVYATLATLSFNIFGLELQN